MSEFEDLDYKSGFSPNSLYDKDLAEKLLFIFSEYKFFDLCRAIFCINAWRYNRAHLNFYLTLNYTLSICKKSGDKQIKHYEDFVAFFNKLKPYFKSYFEDEIVPDFGEIKIAYNNNFYPVFLGTGYNFVFPMMQSLFSLSNSLNIVSEIEEGLIYIKEMVTALSETNRYDGEKDLFIFHLPPQDFFQECMAWYTTKDLNDSNVLKLLINTERSKIEETHFIQFNSEIYPLFNPSIIIDLFHILCRNLKLKDSQRLEAMRVTLYNSLSRNFELNPDSHKLFIQVGIIENLENQTIVDQLLFDFAIIGQDKFLFFINEESAKGKNIINIKRIADEFIKQEQFKVIEFLGNGKCKIANFSFCKDVEFIVYDSEIELTDVTKLIENGQLASHYAYDLLTILYRAKSVDDIVDFLKFKKKSRAQFLSMSGDSAVFELWITQHKELMPGAIQATLVTTDIYPVEWDVFKEYVELSKWYPFENYSNMFANPCCWIINKEYNNNYLMLVNKAVFGHGGFFRKVDDSYLFLTFNFVFEDLTDKGDSRHEAIRMIEDLNFRNFVLFEDALKSSGMYDVYGVQIMYMPMKYAETVDNTGFLKQNRKYVYSDFCFQEGRLFIRYAVNEEQLLQDILNSTTKSVECDYFLELLSCIIIYLILILKGWLKK